MSDEHVKRTYIVEDKWKCPSCGEMNGGRFLKCQKCGTAKSKSDKDVTDLESAEVTDEAALQTANAGANWVCSYCGSQDRTGDGKCRNCGARVEEAKAGDAPGGADQGQAAPSPAVKAPVKKGHPGLFVGLGVVGVGVIAIVALLMPHKKGATVQSTHWIYTVDLEQRQLQHGSGFNAPGDAFNKSCQMRQNGTHDCDAYACNPHQESYDCQPHDCNCHKESTSKKNGYSEVREVCSTCYDKCQKTVQSTCYHQCPTMAQWCSYDFYNWVKLGTQKTQGDTTDTNWPATAASGPDQRVQKKEEYSVGFDAEGKQFSYQPKTLDEFRKFTRGAGWTIKVNAAGQVWPENPAH